MHNMSRENDATVVEAGPSYGSNDETLADFARVIMDAASTCDPPRLIVDMTDTSYIASNFLELLIKAWRKLRDRGGVLAICGIQPFCAEVLHIMRLDSVWGTYPNRAEAAAALAARESGEQGPGE
jgi:anti-anti-sigma factor